MSILFLENFFSCQFVFWWSNFHLNDNISGCHIHLSLYLTGHHFSNVRYKLNDKSWRKVNITLATRLSVRSEMPVEHIHDYHIHSYQINLHLVTSFQPDVLLCFQRCNWSCDRLIQGLHSIQTSQLAPYLMVLPLYTVISCYAWKHWYWQYKQFQTFMS